MDDFTENQYFIGGEISSNTVGICNRSSYWSGNSYSKWDIGFTNYLSYNRSISNANSIFFVN